MLHPSIPGWVLVPIAPHTLSNRPIVLSDASEIAIELVNGRDASASFDMQSLASLSRGDRILVRRSDFVRWAGFEAKLELAVPLLGRKRFRGWLTGVKDDKGGMRLLQALEDGTKDIEFPLDTVSEARLVLNEALIREALKAGKS